MPTIFNPKVATRAAVIKLCAGMLTQHGLSVWQVEFHYFTDSNITKPREMLEVLKGLTNRDMRVFNVEPNYWWHNWAHEFLEFAYLQVIPLESACSILHPCKLSHKYHPGIHPGISSSLETDREIGCKPA